MADANRANWLNGRDGAPQIFQLPSRFVNV
jgi:hypothetical protein